MQMQRVIVEKLQGQRDVADQYAEWGWDAANAHLDSHGRVHGAHAPAHAAGPARDEDGVTRITPDHNDLVAAEQGRHGPRFEHLPALEVGYGVEGERPGHSRDRVEVEILDVAVALEQVLDPLRRQLSRRPSRGCRRRSIRVCHSCTQERLPLSVELYRKILKAHWTLVGAQ